MAELKQYVVSVATAAIICGIVTGMAPGGNLQRILKMICGIFLALMVMEPITRMDADGLISEFAISYNQEADSAAAFGEELARDSMTEYIKQESEAYILDKANDLGLTLDVEVILSRQTPPVPDSAVIRGNIPNNTKQWLEQLIVEDLGIAKEKLQWIG